MDFDIRCRVILFWKPLLESFDDGTLDITGGNSCDGTGPVLLAVAQDPGLLVAIADGSLAGMDQRHAVAGVIEDEARQQSL